MLGFTGMVEVALFADVLTLKEALEFDRHVKGKGDFQLTSQPSGVDCPDTEKLSRAYGACAGCGFADGCLRTHD